MVVIIADDLTGASDTGVKYKKSGFRTMVEMEYNGTSQWDYQWLKQYDVISINTNTRLSGAEKAYRRVYQLTKQVFKLKPEYIYKKIDSLLRGNPAAELDAVMDAVNSDLALVVPSFPENGRTLTKGVLTAPGNFSIDVVKIFDENSKRSVCGIDLSEISKGKNSLQSFIRQKQKQGFQIMVFDSKDDHDLKTIQSACQSLNSANLIFCGSAGFAKHLSSTKSGTCEPAQESSHNQPILIVAGSRRKETALQMKRLSFACRAPIIILDVAKLTGCKQFRQREIEDCTKKLSAAIQDRHRVILLAVSSLFTEHPPCETQNPDCDEISFAEILGIIVRSVFHNAGFQAIVSTGGDTSLQICSSMSAVGIELYDEILSGIPIGRIVGGEADGMTVVTKSGGFGSGDALIKIVQYLEKLNTNFMEGEVK
ncbi:MAG: four-carbon acid sugar kinase family protein [Oscillospiraceae bacterium]|jgi:uncharacterized protein YgbK (DUF1537 family)|nr:four-carbon acid sugar kinase family protein [Oscillospiraceae bacterium]